MTTFQVGRTYSCRSICDHECIFTFTIVARTEKSVLITGGSLRAPTRRKVRIWDGAECIDPLGRYSMSPMLRADRAVY